jgi:tetratricopeptide (TPR) repeat protein
LVIVPIAWITFQRNTIVYSVNTSFVEAILIFIWSITFYPIKFFWPTSLYPAYLLPEPVSALNPPYILAFVVLVILIESIILLRRDRLYVWSWLMYLGGIFYLLRFDNVPYINWAADRFMYLPSLGLCLYFGVILDKSIKLIHSSRRQWAITVLSGILLLYGFLFVKTYRQNFIWKDSITLWSYVISQDPQVSSAYINRGVIYKAQGKLEEALKDYNVAIDINPLSAEAYSNRGNLLLSMKRYEDALTDLNAAVRLNPQLDKSFLNRGNCYYLLKQYEAAEKDFTASIRLNPRNTSALNNRGLIYFRQQKFEKALDDFTAAIQIDGKYVSAYFNRALTYQKLGLVDDARRDFTSAAAFGKK